MSIPGEEPTDIHPQPPKAPRGRLGGATNPWGWTDSERRAARVAAESERRCRDE